MLQSPCLDSQLILDKLRVRSELGGTRLQDLRFSNEGLVPLAPIMIQLGELVSHVGVIPLGLANGSPDDSHSE